MHRRATFFFALSLVATACAQQAPERTPLPPLPTELSFPTTSIVVGSTTTTVPEECSVAVGRGARVTGTLAGYDADEVLLPGDEITFIDGTAITSQEHLLAALSSRSPGDAIQLTFDRGGASQTAAVTVGADEGGTQPRLGASIETALDLYPLPQLPEVEPAADALVVSLDDDLFWLDPAGLQWTAVGSAATGAAVLRVNDDLFSFQPGQTALTAVDGSGTIPLPLDGKGLLGLLGVAGRNILVSVATVADTADADPEILAISVDTLEVEWRLSLPPFEGDPVTTFAGWVAPGGERIAISSVANAQRLHTLVASDGTITGGYGIPDQPFVRADGLIGGWLDASRLAYAFADTNGLSLGIADLTSDEEDRLVPLQGTTLIRQVWTLPLRDRVVVSTPTESILFNLETATSVHRLAAGCEAFVVTASIG